MAKGYKGITVEIDGSTEKFDNALKKVNTSAKETQKELRGLNTLSKLDPNSTELAAQKQYLLAKAISETEEKLKLLKTAEKEAAEAGKDVSDEAYRDLQREIVLTQSKLEDLKKEQSVFEKLKNGAKMFTAVLAKPVVVLGKLVAKIPFVKKLGNALGNAFGTVKTKIIDAIKNSEKIKAIGTAIENVKNKVAKLADKIPVINKIASGFRLVGKAIDAVKEKLPHLSTVLSATGKAATAAAKGGFSLLEKTIKTTVAGFTAYATAAVTAAVAIGKSAIESYADYEQLVGGVETLFGAGGQSLTEYAKSAGTTTADAREKYNSLMKAQETVLKNADNAYKTAGLSANEYMETVTGFSAALISSMGGDTEAAAEKANTAITDMADNANKMGSDISSIQTAYSGFAKQNYTMLDNLKLGYGGTKEEMQRLLDDATKLSNVEYDLSSYADIVDAIHVIQTEMGITGTTAKEASETISGSTAAAKSAYENLLAGIANEDADMDALIAQMIEAVETVVKNVAPRITQTATSLISNVPKIISGLSEVAAGAAGELAGVAQTVLPELTQSFFTLISSVIQILPELLPKLSETAADFFMGLLEGLNTTIPQIAAQIPTLLNQITATLAANLPQIITVGMQILLNLVNGITAQVPTLIGAITTLLPLIVGAITESLPQIVEAGLKLLLALVSGIIEAIPQLIDMLPMIIQAIVETLIMMLPQIIEAGTILLNALITGIAQAIPQLISMLPTIISSTVNTLIANLPKIISMGIEMIGALISGLIQAIPALLAAIPQVYLAIYDTFTAVNWGDLGKNIIDGIIAGVKNAKNALIETFKDMASEAMDAVKDFFDINSPSRKMRDEVGKMLPAGMAEGVEEGMDEQEDRIRKAMQRGVPTTIDSYINVKAGSPKTDTTAAAGGFVQNLTINSPRELSPSEAARQTRNATRQMILKLQPT